MAGKELIDLVILGILHRTSVVEERLPAIAKSIVPDLWCPTSDVITEAIERNKKFKFLICTRNLPRTLDITKAGKDRFQALISLRLEANAGTLCYVFEAIQLCFLDNAMPEIIQAVLEQQSAHLSMRLAELQRRCEHCPDNGHYMRLWMGMERRLLETKAEVISEACRKFSN